MAFNRFTGESYRTSTDLRPKPTFSSSEIPPPIHEYAAGGCFREDSRSRIVLRTMELVQFTIVIFADTKIVFRARIVPRQRNTIEERDGGTLTMFPPRSLNAAEESAVAIGIFNTIPAAGQTPWSLEAVQATRKAIYCTTYLDDTGVFQIVEAWGYSGHLVDRDTSIYSPAAWFGSAKATRVGRIEKEGCYRVHCCLDTGDNIVLDIPATQMDHTHIAKKRYTAMFRR
ncbi:hypothetical protein B0H16DRAFT_1736348 [Mycena metata]|uniref:Uncharacterized protein n=1 Tax=Mycena metata TaxID=1033252 RepID=A0AAD7HNY9_9AGAR|nr:hypothetical protein B0H16DRAFT_1736348 [Mycena metata]